MRISDWSSDVCSSDLGSALGAAREIDGEAIEQTTLNRAEIVQYAKRPVLLESNATAYGLYVSGSSMEPRHLDGDMILIDPKGRVRGGDDVVVYLRPLHPEDDDGRSEEHTSELQSLMRISYAVFCLKKKKPNTK